MADSAWNILYTQLGYSDGRGKDPADSLVIYQEQGWP
jgi:hypothetical protein